MLDIPRSHDLTVTLTLAAGAIADGIHVERVEGREAVSECYHFRAVFRSDDAVASSDVVGEVAKLTIATEAGAERAPAAIAPG